MRKSAVIPVDAQQDYWRVVRSCIRAFHPEQSANALRKATRLRRTVENLPRRELELFFHAEPFDVACDLAGHRLEVSEHLNRYLKIRDRE
jgi:hypothetical protein